MTDSLNTPDSNDTPDPVGQPLSTPETVTPTSFTPNVVNKGSGGFRLGFSLLFLAGFAVATVFAFNYSVNSVVNDTPMLSEPVVELFNSPFNDDLDPVVITDQGTLVIPVTEDSVIPLEIEIPFDAQPGDVIDFPLPEGGVVIPPGGQVTFELQSTEGPLQGDGEIVIELSGDSGSATVTDTEGNVTHLDQDGNVITPTVVDPPASK